MQLATWYYLLFSFFFIFFPFLFLFFRLSLSIPFSKMYIFNCFWTIR